VVPPIDHAVHPPIDHVTHPVVDHPVVDHPGTGSGSSTRTLDDVKPPGSGSSDPGPGSSAPSNDEQAQLAEFYAKAGDAALRGGDPVSAASNFQKALAANAGNVDAIIGLGEVAVAQGVYADALRQLKKAAKLAPKRARVHILLGEAYLNTGNATAAAAAFKKALVLDPGDTRAINGYNEAVGRLPPVPDDP
jgi:Tfp pilus assembly protein PilF